MKILKLLLVYVNVLFGSTVILENQLAKEIKINGIELGKTTFKEFKGIFGFDLEMHKIKDSYDGKLYDTKDVCIEDKQKGIFLLISSSSIPSSFSLIDIFKVSYVKDKSVIGLKCHEDAIKFETKNYLGYTREQIINIFGINYEKTVEYQIEEFSYRVEKEIEALYKNKLRVLYPSKGIFFCFKDNKVIKYSVDALMEYGKYINYEKLCERVQNKQRLSEKDFSKIINSTYIYKLHEECDLNLNASVDIRSGTTFLIQAIRQKKYKTIQYLLKNKADIEGVDGDNNTPLLVAIGYNDKRAIKLLLKYNANILVKNKEGESAKKLLKEMNIDVTKLMITPKFKNYSILSKYNDKNKPLIQKSFGRLYKTLLKKALKEKKQSLQENIS